MWPPPPRKDDLYDYVVVAVMMLLSLCIFSAVTILVIFLADLARHYATS